MGYRQGTSRDQMSFSSLDDMVAPQSMARVIDRFVEVTDLSLLGFTRTQAADTGRPGMAAAPLVKLYLYGYENAIRSSRNLAREATRNIEAMWLLESLTPDYKTIAEFRRINVLPLRELFKSFTKLCRHWNLADGNMIAGDGSKFKASNNKKNNFSQKKLTNRLQRLDEKITAYLKQMDESDESDQADESDSANTPNAPATL